MIYLRQIYMKTIITLLSVYYMYLKMQYQSYTKIGGHPCFHSNLPKTSATPQKINVDNKIRFRYLDFRRLCLFEFPYVGLWLNPLHNSHFFIIYWVKSWFSSIQSNFLHVLWTCIAYCQPLSPLVTFLMLYLPEMS
jgi:hypothetical protein